MKRTQGGSDTSRVTISESEPELDEEYSQSGHESPPSETRSHRVPSSSEIADRDDFCGLNYSPQTENSALVDTQEEHCDSYNNSELEGGEESELSTSENENSVRENDFQAPMEVSEPITEGVQGNEEVTGIGKERKSGTEELNFTLDHFGPDTTLSEAAGDNVGTIFDENPLSQKAPPLLTSTANRETEGEKSKYLSRQSRVNRGVPRTKLDL